MILDIDARSDSSFSRTIQKVKKFLKFRVSDLSPKTTTSKEVESQSTLKAASAPWYFTKLSEEICFYMVWNVEHELSTKLIKRSQVIPNFYYSKIQECSSKQSTLIFMTQVILMHLDIHLLHVWNNNWNKDSRFKSWEENCLFLLTSRKRWIKKGSRMEVGY